MKRGVTTAQAARDLDALAAAFTKRFPNNYRNGFSTTVRPLQDEIVGDTSRALFVLLGAVGLVLLIACANVANLLLARAASRRREIAMRAALGASRGASSGSCSPKACVIAAAGGGIGLLLAVVGRTRAGRGGARQHSAAATRSASTSGSLRSRRSSSLATGVLFGVAPALTASRADVHDTLKEGGRAGGGAQRRAGQVLVIAEVALSIVLLVGAGLLMRSFARVQDVAPGFEPQRLLTLRLSLPESRYTTFARGDAFFDALFAGLRSRRRDSRRRRDQCACRSAASAGAVRSTSTAVRRSRPGESLEEQLRIVPTATSR